jgi:O-antigen/teichoic acid export membrane protein
MNNVLAAIMGYVAMFFILRYMGKDALGITAFAISFVGLFSFIANLGFDSAHIKRISEGKDEGKCNGTYFAIKVGLIAAFIGVVFISVFVWTDILGHGFETSIHEDAIYVSIAYWAMFSLVMGFVATFNGRKEIARSQTIRFTNDFVRGLLIVVVAVTSMGVIALTGAYLAGTLMALGVALFFFIRLPVSRPDKEYARSEYS